MSWLYLIIFYTPLNSAQSFRLLVRVTPPPLSLSLSVVYKISSDWFCFLLQY